MVRFLDCQNCTKRYLSISNITTTCPKCVSAAISPKLATAPTPELLKKLSKLKNPLSSPQSTVTAQCTTLDDELILTQKLSQNKISQPCNSKKPIPIPIPIDREKLSEDPLCFICGRDFGAEIGRKISHLKSCSRKYGVQLADHITYHDSDDSGCDSDTSSDSGSDLNLDSADSSSDFEKENEITKAAVVATSKAQRQPPLENFFTVPAKNINAVLLQGAKTLAKKKVPPPNSNSNKRKRKNQFNREITRMPAFKIIQSTNIIVDGFQVPNYNSSTYFLSHFHSDHFTGITSDWKQGTIFCSHTTATLVHQQLGVEKRYLCPVKLNTPTLLTAPEDTKNQHVIFTLLDANHCPGAVMIFFQIGPTRILHVGDFRFSRSIMLDNEHNRQLSMIASDNNSAKLDVLYLDTTYCDPKYDLPPQSDAIAAALGVVKLEIENAKASSTLKPLFLFGAYTIGKENLYMAVAERLNLKVYVDKQKRRTMEAFTPDWSEARQKVSERSGGGLRKTKFFYRATSKPTHSIRFRTFFARRRPSPRGRRRPIF